MQALSGDCDCYPHGPDDPCTCDGCWACEGHITGCTCDINWECTSYDPCALRARTVLIPRELTCKR